MFRCVYCLLVLAVLTVHFHSIVRSEAVSEAISANLEACRQSDGIENINNCSYKHKRLLINQRNVSETQSTAFENHLEGSSILYGLSKVANENLVTQVCLNELKEIRRSVLLKKPWAMKVFDASASKPAGFMYQHNFWLGSRDTCATAKDPLGLTLYKIIKRNMKPGLVEEVAPFDVEFRVVYLKLNSPWQLPLEFFTKPILHVGLCLPASCSSSEVKQLTQELIQLKSFVPADHYEFNADVLYVKDLKLKAEFFERSSFKMLTALVIFTGVMMLGAFYINKNTTLAASKTSEKKSDVYIAKAGNETVSKAKRSDERSEGVLTSFIKCFDIHENYQQIFASSVPMSNDIPFINGFRSISAFAVLIVHVLIYLFHTLNNTPFILAQLELKPYQVLTIPFYLVDAFFAISGFLQTFQFFLDTKGMETIRVNSFMQNVRRWFYHLFHRYIRLAPLYFVTLASVDLISAFLNDVSVFHIYNRYDELCPKYWWRNLFFIQAFFRAQDLCVNWTWTLSCEMQYFIVCSMLLFTYVKHPKLVKYIIVALLPCNVGFILYRGITHQFQFGFEAAYLSINEIYITPLVRGIPYILGSISAWYFMEKKRQLNISPALERWLWNLTPLLMFSCAFTMYWRDLSYFASICIYLLGRVAMSLAVCWLVVGSAMGRGTWWSRILEASVFQHVHRLTYAIYLLNPALLVLLVTLSDTSLHGDFIMLIVYGCGFSVIVYLASIGFSLAFEVPYSNLYRKMTKRNKAKVV